MVEQYVERVHTEHAVLDIGQGTGALVVYTHAEWCGVEIEISPKGQEMWKAHNVVRERRTGEHSVFAALFPALSAGDYVVWRNPSGAYDPVTVTGGHVATIDWRDATDVFPPSAMHSHRFYAGLQQNAACPSPYDACDILPPRYRNGRAVSAAPMGTASMLYDDDGQVAWNEMWTGFCELALAGGPAHRGTLLEPAAPEEIRAAPDDYERVVIEIERGLRLVTGLPTMRSTNRGWVGLVCPTEDAALWLLRAIVVENVCVRREGNVLFLPAGPAFGLDKEIKNVITVVAKTYHYWTEHMRAAY